MDSMLSANSFMLAIKQRFKQELIKVIFESLNIFMRRLKYLNILITEWGNMMNIGM